MLFPPSPLPPSPPPRRRLSFAKPEPAAYYVQDDADHVNKYHTILLGLDPSTSPADRRDGPVVHVASLRETMERLECSVSSGPRRRPRGRSDLLRVQIAALRAVSLVVPPHVGPRTRAGAAPVSGGSRRPECADAVLRTVAVDAYCEAPQVAD